MTDVGDILDQGAQFAPSRGASALKASLEDRAGLKLTLEGSTDVHTLASTLRIRMKTTGAAGADYAGAAELRAALSDRDDVERIYGYEFSDEKTIYTVYASAEREVIGVTAVRVCLAPPISEGGEVKR